MGIFQSQSRGWAFHRILVIIKTFMVYMVDGTILPPFICCTVFFERNFRRIQLLVFMKEMKESIGIHEGEERKVDYVGWEVGGFILAEEELSILWMTAVRLGGGRIHVLTHNNENPPS